MSDWLIDGKRSRLRNLRVLECGRRVHVAGLREAVEVRCLGDWHGWWERLQAKASNAHLTRGEVGV